MVGAMGQMSQPMSNPLTKAANRAYMPGEGVRETYGGESAVVVGEITMIGVRLLGGVGGLLSRMTGETSSERISPSLCSRVKRSIGIGRHGMGAMILGESSRSGKPLVESV